MLPGVLPRNNGKDRQRPCPVRGSAQLRRKRLLTAHDGLSAPGPAEGIWGWRSQALFPAGTSGPLMRILHSTLRYASGTAPPILKETLRHDRPRDSLPRPRPAPTSPRARHDAPAFIPCRRSRNRPKDAKSPAGAGPEDRGAEAPAVALLKPWLRRSRRRTGSRSRRRTHHRCCRRE